MSGPFFIINKKFDPFPLIKDEWLTGIFGNVKKDNHERPD